MHTYFGLEYQQKLYVESDEPDQYLRQIDGLVYELDEADGKTHIGEFRIFLIDVESAVTDGEHVFSIFDSRQETVDYYSLLGSSTLEFKDCVLNALPGGERWSPNMLILDRLTLLPAYRGKGIGLRVLRNLFKQFRMGCGIVVMRPYPLQFEGGAVQKKIKSNEFQRLRLDLYDKNFHRALKRLRTHYALLGFKKVAGMPYMVADPLLPIPSVDLFSDGAF